MRKAVQQWVHPDFHKAMKRMALDKDTNVLDLSRDLAKLEDPFAEFQTNKNEKKPWKFRI